MGKPFPLLSSSICSERQPLGISGTSFLFAGCPSRYPTVSIKALEEIQSYDHNQKLGLIQGCPQGRQYQGQDQD